MPFFRWQIFNQPIVFTPSPPPRDHLSSLISTRLYTIEYESVCPDSSRLNWVPRPHSPASECDSPTLACVGGDEGYPIQTTGQTLWYTHSNPFTRRRAIGIAAVWADGRRGEGPKWVDSKNSGPPPIYFLRFLSFYVCFNLTILVNILLCQVCRNSFVLFCQKHLGNLSYNKLCWNLQFFWKYFLLILCKK